ncbi:MAG TPA: hypothetical protein VI056_06200 [Candidatus Limnocylindria bacterium]
MLAHDGVVEARKMSRRDARSASFVARLRSAAARMMTVCATSSAQWPARAFAQSDDQDTLPIEHYVLGVKVEMQDRAARPDRG